MKKARNSFILFCVLIRTAVCDNNENAKEGVLWEYCQGKYFSPQCDTDEVIIMEKARYGHIQLGRCIDTDLGHLGCEIDQLSWLDQLCSGKTTCSFDVIDDNIEGQVPCTAALVRYLEAKYKCLRVNTFTSNDCKEEANVPVKSRVQYLSSSTTAISGCGTDIKPWMLQAKPGQQINISITDFNWRAKTDGVFSHPCPVRYGYMIDIELNEAIDICGGSLRYRHLHLSKGSSLQIIINTDLSENKFIISYQAIGCPTFVTPADTWVKHENEVMTVGCNHNDQVWKMRCIGSNWIGIPENCETLDVEDTRAVSANVDKKLLLGMTPVVTFTIIGGVFLIILSVTITVLVGMFCIQKTNTEKKGYGYHMTPLTYYDQTLQMNNTIPGFRSIQSQNRQTLLPQTLNSSETDSFAGNHNNHGGGNSTSPHYFVLERDDKPIESPYDTVYQNVA